MNRLLFSIGVLFFVFAAFFACQTSDDDSSTSIDNIDDDDDDDGDNWTDDGCEYEQKVALKTDDQGCPPPLPDPALADPLDAMLTAYLGQYEDQNGVEIEISCNPDGEWLLPHFLPDIPCDFYYLLPVNIQIGEAPAIAAKITNYAGGTVEQDPLAFQARLEVLQNGVYLHGQRKTVDGRLVWEIDNGDVWTKKNTTDN